MNQLSDRITYVSPNGWYSLSYPAAWVCETEEVCTTFYIEAAGRGTLQLSAYEAPEPQSALANLLEYIQDEGIQTEPQSRISKLGQEVAECVFEKDDWITHVWIVTKGVHLIFITYLTEPPKSHKEAREVEAILDSLQITSTYDLS